MGWAFELRYLGTLRTTLLWMDGWVFPTVRQANHAQISNGKTSSSVCIENEATPQASNISRIAKRKHAQAQMHARDADDAVLSCIDAYNIRTSAMRAARSSFSTRLNGYTFLEDTKTTRSRATRSQAALVRHEMYRW